jgi:hypothetical protein
VTPFQPDPGLREQGQALLSGTWALIGAGALVAGLLIGAFAWQRIRPRPLPDLREVPGVLR